jgi:Fe-S-cluster-containing hydrogenase component 2
MAMKIVQSECTSCGDCKPKCPTNSIVEKSGIFKINKDSCNECEDRDEPQCVATCPAGDTCIVPLTV